ncbi:YbaB/EbfC family nucleoid-associated protein [Haloechinothrix salitolerans]|uniref:YbaB/EbfC family nucleoid-associated protein n=1 Tax=Haloechinothrix salitolerans TaxID=926830 RepID=A0ABW2C8I2_9PSEU
MTDHRAQVNQLLADYARSREQLATVHQRLAAITATERSADGGITVTVGSRGTLTGLTLADDVYRAHRPSELATEILRLVTSASRRALAEAADVLAPTLPAGTDSKAMLRGTADLTPDELPPEPRPTPRDSPEDADDEDFAATNWVAEGRRGTS